MSRGILTRGRSSRLKLRCCNFIAEHVVLAPRRTQKGDVQTQVRNSKHLNYLDSRLSLWIFCWTVSLSLLTKLWFFQPLCLEHHHMIRETWFLVFFYRDLFCQCQLTAQHWKGLKVIFLISLFIGSGSKSSLIATVFTSRTDIRWVWHRREHS